MQQHKKKNMSRYFTPSFCLPDARYRFRVGCTKESMHWDLNLKTSEPQHTVIRSHVRGRHDNIISWTNATELPQSWKYLPGGQNSGNTQASAQKGRGSTRYSGSLTLRCQVGCLLFCCTGWILLCYDLEIWSMLCFRFFWILNIYVGGYNKIIQDLYHVYTVINFTTQSIVWFKTKNSRFETGNPTRKKKST